MRERRATEAETVEPRSPAASLSDDLSSRPVPNKERNERIVALRRAGVGPRQIARWLGYSPNVVAGVLDRAGLADAAHTNARATLARQPTEAVISAIVEGGGASRHAAALWGVSPKTVTRYRAKHRRQSQGAATQEPSHA
jgi:hypothetical protein